MKYTVLVLHSASIDLIEISDYYESIRKDLATAFVEEWEIAIKLIEQNPLAFQLKRKQYRSAQMKRFPYLIVFDIEDSAIIVYNVFHNKRNPKRIFKER